MIAFIYDAGRFTDRIHRSIGAEAQGSKTIDEMMMLMLRMMILMMLVMKMLIESLACLQ